MSDARSEEPGNLRISLFGPFEVLIGGQLMRRVRSRKDLLLLALLIVRHGKEVRRDWLAETLWPDSRADSSLAYLRQSLCNLRKAMGAEAVRVHAKLDTIRLDDTGAVIDLVAFDDAIVRGDIDSLRTALTLYGGPFLEGYSENWVEHERRVREENWFIALIRVAEIERGCGRPHEACSYLRLAIRQDPLRESTHRVLMEVLADLGDYAAITAVYRDLRLVLRREANADPSSETAALYERLRGLTYRPTPLQAVHHPDTPRLPVPVLLDLDSDPSARREIKATSAASQRRTSASHLPRPLTSLIGRQTTVREILDALQANRLVTLTGTGGVGKTRLALEAARASELLCDVWYVELAALTNTSLIADSVAAVLQISEVRGASVDEIVVRHLTDTRGLLVLDNCEHLLEAASNFVTLLLKSCPEITILATSRQAMGIAGETLYPVPTMQMPPAAPEMEGEVAGDQFDRLCTYEAIQLFSVRVQAVAPAFRITPQNLIAVRDICQAVDGIPLAIELAAAWASVLAPEQILDSLIARRFDLLVSRRRDQDHRHHSVWAMLDASWQLLTHALQRFLAFSSTFRGGWTLEAAALVCLQVQRGPASREAMEQALSFLAQLQDQSLIQVHSSRNTMRYSLLETVREYASERIEAEELEEAASSHATYFLALVEQAALHLIGPLQVEWLDRLEDEQHNLSAALNWCAGRESLTEIGLRICIASWRFWDVRGRHHEGIEWMALFISRDHEVAQSLRAQAREAIGLIHADILDKDQTRRWSLEALEIYSEIADTMGQMRVLCTIGITETNMNMPDSARARFEACLPVLKILGDAYELGRALSGLAMLEQYVRNYEKVKPLLQLTAENYRACGHTRGIALTLYRLGGIAMVHGQFDRAHELFNEALDLTRAVRDMTTLPYALFHIGHNSYLQNDFSRARPYLREAIDRSHTNRNYAVEGTCHLLLGDIAMQEEDIQAACAWYSGSLVPFYRPITAAATSLVGSRLIPHAISTGRTTDALRLAAYVSANMTPRRASDTQLAFMLYMSLGNMYVEKDTLETQIDLLRSLLPDTFELLWQEGLTLTQHEGTAYVRKLAELFATDK